MDELEPERVRLDEVQVSQVGRGEPFVWDTDVERVSPLESVICNGIEKY